MQVHQHAYLGELEDVQHLPSSYFAPSDRVLLPLVYLEDTVLFPGDDVPLRMFSSASMDAIRQQVTQEGVLLGVLCPRQRTKHTYGTTVRIEKFNVVARCASVMGSAKQRFRLQHVDSLDGRPVLGHVEILDNEAPRRPPFARKKKHQGTSRAYCRKRQWGARFGSYWGHEVFDCYDAEELVERLQCRLRGSSVYSNWFREFATSDQQEQYRIEQQQAHEDAGGDADGDTEVEDSDEDGGSLMVPSKCTYLHTPAHEQDPERFAFWLAGLLPLDTVDRLELLASESTVSLLRREIELLVQLDAHINCVGCGTYVAATSDMFCWPGGGGASTFVNPGGFVIQVMMLRVVCMANVMVEGPGETAHTWFPGYAWSFAHCTVCMAHLGWQFAAADAEDEDPRSSIQFFAFRRAALTQGTVPAVD